ncbi:alpha-2,8-polysialyltransferase family protein, partial [Sinorhizobium meliloti]
MTSGDVVGGATSALPAGTDLIIISNGRQAQNALAFIEEFGETLLLRPFVLTLYTDANLKERSSISNLLTEKHVPHGLLKLPVGAAYFSLRKQGRILRAYRSVLTKNTPRRLFLFNYNTHYGLVYDLAKRAEMQVFFIEEGLSSYKKAHAYAPPRSLIDIINKDII